MTPELTHDAKLFAYIKARNLDRMLAFARAYPEPGEFSPRAAAKSTADSLGQRRRTSDAPTIGLILCQRSNQMLARTSRSACRPST